MPDIDEQTAELLRNKPQRQKKPGLKSLLLLLGGLVILGALFVAAWQVYALNNPSSPAQSKTNTGNQGGDGASNPWENYPSIYWQTLKTQIAQGLHMDEQQVVSKVQSQVPATQTTNGSKFGLDSSTATTILNNLAHSQGLSQAQLHTIEVNAIQQAHAVLVQRGVLTQQQASKNLQALLALDRDNINLHVVSAFLTKDR
jgi:hypothetical protein